MRDHAKPSSGEQYMRMLPVFMKGEGMKQKDVEIIRDFGIIGRTKSGYTKHFILAKWFNHPPKYEVRTFAPDGEPLKLTGMTPSELENLRSLLQTEVPMGGA